MKIYPLGLLCGLVLYATGCMGQIVLTTGSVQLTTASVATAPAVVTPITTSTTSIASVTSAPAAVPAPGFGAPAWLVQAARADNYTETSGQPLTTAKLDEAHLTETPLMAAAHAFQPTGSLSGKVIYAMAGHGWTYDEDRQVYYTQRSMSNNIVEDFGNLDQMHIFAHLLWNSGATVVPLRPIDHQPNERILDNSSPQVQLYGNWRASSSKVFYGTSRDQVPYVFAPAARNETAIARFRPWIPEAGEYPVYAWARDGADRVSSQLYRVVHAGGVTELHVNHRRVGKGWVWLGSF
jgi:hypothetical protein